MGWRSHQEQIAAGQGFAAILVERLALTPVGQKLADVGLFEGAGIVARMRPLFMVARR
jgi:hypothetical protein